MKILSRAPRGLSLLEVMLAGVILSLCCICLLDAMVTATTSTRESGEYAAAVVAARKKLEEITATKFDQLVQKYGKNAPTVGNTFKVYLNETLEVQSGAGKVQGMELPGFYKTVNGAANYDAGEIVIVTDESKAPSTYGYSCSMDGVNLYPDSGNPGGINFTGIPLDLNGDGLISSGSAGNMYDLSTTPAIKSAVRLPVGVMVRWLGPHGPERVELWSIVSNF